MAEGERTERRERKRYIARERGRTRERENERTRERENEITRERENERNRWCIADQVVRRHTHPLKHGEEIEPHPNKTQPSAPSVETSIEIKISMKESFLQQVSQHFVTAFSCQHQSATRTRCRPSYALAASETRGAARSCLPRPTLWLTLCRPRPCWCRTGSCPR